MLILCHYAICVRNKKLGGVEYEENSYGFASYLTRNLIDNANQHNDSIKGDRYTDQEHTPNKLDASVWATRISRGND